MFEKVPPAHVDGLRYRPVTPEGRRISQLISFLVESGVNPNEADRIAFEHKESSRIVVFTYETRPPEVYSVAPEEVDDISILTETLTEFDPTAKAHEFNDDKEKE